MVEVSGITSRKLAERLLDEYNILIKDLAPKLEGVEGSYVRIAVKSSAEDDVLIDALRKIFS